MRRSRSIEHQVHLIEAEQGARLGQDALGEVIDPARALQCQSGLEQTRERRVRGQRRIAVRADGVEAQHQEQHQASEQREDCRGAGVIEHGRKNAGRYEDEIRQRIAGRDDAPHVTTVEVEEESHQPDIDHLSGHSHHDQGHEVGATQTVQWMAAATGEVRLPGEYQHQHGHRGVVDGAQCGHLQRALTVAAVDQRPGQRCGATDACGHRRFENQQEPDLRKALHRNQAETRGAQSELPYEQARTDAQQHDPPGREIDASQQCHQQRAGRHDGEQHRIDGQCPVSRPHPGRYPLRRDTATGQLWHDAAMRGNRTSDTPAAASVGTALQKNASVANP